jgi:ABC-type multidrug transport system fused ATPase/permease subunit
MFKLSEFKKHYKSLKQKFNFLSKIIFLTDMSFYLPKRRTILKKNGPAQVRYSNINHRVRITFATLVTVCDAAVRVFSPLFLSEFIKKTTCDETCSDIGKQNICATCRSSEIFPDFSASSLLYSAIFIQFIVGQLPTLRKSILYLGLGVNTVALSNIADDAARLALMLPISKLEREKPNIQGLLYKTNTAFEQFIPNVVEGLHSLLMNMLIGSTIAIILYKEDESRGIDVGVFSLIYILFVGFIVNSILNKFIDFETPQIKVDQLQSEFNRSHYELFQKYASVRLFNCELLEKKLLTQRLSKYLKCKEYNSKIELALILQPVLGTIMTAFAIKYLTSNEPRIFHADDIIFLLGYIANMSGQVNNVSSILRNAIVSTNSLETLNDLKGKIDSSINSGSGYTISKKSNRGISRNNQMLLQIPLLSRSNDNPLETEISSKKLEITFNDLTLRFSKKSGYLFSKLNFNIPPGLHVGLVGKTGSGKSSIFSLLCNLLDAEYTGEILIDKKNIRNIDGDDLRKNVSIVKQETDIFDTESIKYNVLYGYASQIILEKLHSSNTKIYNYSESQIELLFKYKLRRYPHVEYHLDFLKKNVILNPSKILNKIFSGRFNFLFIPIRLSKNEFSLLYITKQDSTYKIYYFDPAQQEIPKNLKKGITKFFVNHTIVCYEKPLPEKTEYYSDILIIEAADTLMRENITFPSEPDDPRLLRKSQLALLRREIYIKDCLPSDVKKFSNSYIFVSVNNEHNLFYIDHELIKHLLSLDQVDYLNVFASTTQILQNSSDDEPLSKKLNQTDLNQYWNVIAKNRNHNVSLDERRPAHVLTSKQSQQYKEILRKVDLFKRRKLNFSGSLSGGEKQRIGIARVLGRDTPIVLLDEPTAALDPETEHHIMDNIYTLFARKTMVIAAHRLSTITRCRRIMLLGDGNIKEQGSHEELLAKQGAYFRMCNLQGLSLN